MKTTQSAKKAPSSRTVRRRVLAVLKPTVSAPLSAEESKRLHEMVEIANKSNHELIEAGFNVKHCRDMLRDAESQFLAARKENQAIHAEIAPLFHRLPTV